MENEPSYLDLYDYRCRVAALYRERNKALAAGSDPTVVFARFREVRDDLFARHPQSALDEEQRRRFQQLDYFPYNPAARVEAVLDVHVDAAATPVATSGEQSMTMRRVALATFSYAAQACELTLYWIDVYGGGLFLPFRDLSAPEETYGGGRYLVDTVKGSDFSRLWHAGERWRVVLDFNYAYNPSCAYHYRWACPLAPLENRLTVRIDAGERRFAGHVEQM